MEYILKVSGLTKYYGNKRVVNNLSLQVKSGEIFGLLGPNGAGKSTTIECILGTKTRNGGEVELLGQVYSKPDKALLQKIGVQFQASYYPDRIKVKEMCTMIASLYKETEDVDQLLRQFSLLDKENKMIASLSGGERQKLSVVLALMNKPKIVFLDELTTGLDPQGRREVWKYLKGLQGKDVTIFLTSHYMDEVENLCHQVLIMKDGEEIIKGTPAEIIASSGTDRLEDAYLYYIGAEGGHI